MKNGKTTTMLAALALAFCLTAPTALAQQQQEGEVLLQEARHKEIVDGDLEEAISLYQKIVDNVSDIGRAVAARALVQMGKSYEKLGVHLVAEARQAYEQVVRDYADQPDMVAEARGRLEALEAAVAAAAGPDEPKALTIRKVVSRRFYGALSPDGRYFTDGYWKEGPNLGLYDMKSGDSRVLTDEGTWDQPSQFGDISIWSPDSKQIAYAWYKTSKTRGYHQELRIVNVDGGEPRIFEDAPYPRAWSRDGKYIVGPYDEKAPYDENPRLTLFEIETGSLRTIKNSLDDVHTWHLSISADGKHVLYGAYEDGEGSPRDIHIVSTDGRLDQPLIDHPADDYAPFWTPDGRGVVFVSDRSGTTGLWYAPVVEAKVASEPRLIRQGFNGEPYGFTDDGTFYYSEGYSSHNIFVAELDADFGMLPTTPELVSERFDGNIKPFWSPDGSKLAYLSTRDPGHVAVVIRDMKSGQEQDIEIWNLLPKLRGDVRWMWPRWSPDGKAILVRAKSLEDELQLPGQYLIDVETKRATRIAEGNIHFIVFTPDGEDVIFARQKITVPGSEIIRRNITSGAEVSNSNECSELWTRLRAMGQAGEITEETVWARYAAAGCLAGERVLSDRPLDSRYFLEISPDGSQLAYFEGDSKTRFRDLIVMSLKDGSTRTLWTRPKEVRVNAVRLRWMPDGKHLLLAAGSRAEDPADTEYQLYLVDVNSGERKPVGRPLKHQNYGPAVLHPNGTTLAFSRGEEIYETWAIENLVFDQ